MHEATADAAVSLRCNAAGRLVHRPCSSAASLLLGRFVCATAARAPIGGVVRVHAVCCIAQGGDCQGGVPNSAQSVREGDISTGKVSVLSAAALARCQRCCQHCQKVQLWHLEQRTHASSAHAHAHAQPWPTPTSTSTYAPYRYMHAGYTLAMR